MWKNGLNHHRYIGLFSLNGQEFVCTNRPQLSLFHSGQKCASALMQFGRSNCMQGPGCMVNGQDIPIKNDLGAMLLHRLQGQLCYEDGSLSL